MLWESSILFREAYKRRWLPLPSLFPYMMWLHCYCCLENMGCIIVLIMRCDWVRTGLHPQGYLKLGHNNNVEHHSKPIDMASSSPSQTLGRNHLIFSSWHSKISLHISNLWEWAIALHGRLLVPSGWLQVTCVGHCSICQSENVGKYL